MIAAARKLFALLHSTERRQFTWILVGMLVTSIIATAGVASIMPFMSLVARPESVDDSEWLGRIYDTVGFGTPVQFLFAAGLLTLVLLLIGNALRAFTDWKIMRFSREMEHRLSRRLLASYLSQPYAFYLSRNTAALSQKILYEVGSVVTGVLMPGMRAIAQAMTATFILMLLLVVDVLLALSAALVLGATYGAIYAAVRRSQARLGRERMAANQQRFRIAAEAFGGIKDVKVLGRERHFLRRYERPSQRFARTVADNAIIGELPRHALEALAFGGILVVLLYYLGTGQPVDRALPVLGLYAFAAYRLMPSLQHVFVAVNQARFNIAALNELHEDLLGANRPEVALNADAATELPPPLPFAREVRLRRVSFTYPASDTPALTSVDLSLPRNRTVGLVGPTGSGKTTLVDLLLGLYLPTGGSISVDDTQLDAAQLPSWRRMVGYVPQQIFLGDDTVLRNIAFGVPDSDIDRDAAERAAQIAQLHDFILSLPDGYDTIVGERGVRLSGGQRQRIGIARALYHDPEVLVLDEATSALDTLTEEAVMDAIQRLAGRKTMVMIAHRLSTVADCDVIYLLDNGRVVAQGTYDSLRRSHAMFKAMTGDAPAASA